MSTGTGTNHCCGSMANAFARLVTPQPNCRLILLLLSYLAAPVTIQAHSHNHCRNICLDFSLYHLSVVLSFQLEFTNAQCASVNSYGF